VASSSKASTSVSAVVRNQSEGIALSFAARMLQPALLAPSRPPFGCAQGKLLQRTEDRAPTPGTVHATGRERGLGLGCGALQAGSEIFTPVIRQGGGIDRFLQQIVIVFIAYEKAVHLGDGDAGGIAAE